MVSALANVISCKVVASVPTTNRPVRSAARIVPVAVNRNRIGSATSLAAITSILAAQGADAAEIMQVAAGDSRAGLLLFPLTAAVGWVLFNIAGPALNQLNTMSEKKSVAAGLGIGAASLLAAQGADAAEIMQVAAGDSRAGLLLFPLTAAVGWVLFNIAGPALNQLNTMSEKKK